TAGGLDADGFHAAFTPRRQRSVKGRKAAPSFSRERGRQAERPARLPPAVAQLFAAVRVPALETGPRPRAAVPARIELPARALELAPLVRAGAFHAVLDVAVDFRAVEGLGLGRGRYGKRGGS